MNHITRSIDTLEHLAFSDDLTKKLEVVQTVFGEMFCLYADIIIQQGLGKKPMIIKADKAAKNTWLWDIYFDDHKFSCGVQHTHTPEDRKVNDIIMKYLFGGVPKELGHICFETTTVR